jgi:hypothetical protein
LPRDEDNAADQAYAIAETLALPDDTRFLNIEFLITDQAVASAANGAEPTRAAPDGSSPAAAVPIDGWSQPVLFFPDGTTSAARLYVVNDNGQAVEILLRALTGTSRRSDIQVIDDRWR